MANDQIIDRALVCVFRAAHTTLTASLFTVSVEFEDALRHRGGQIVLTIVIQVKNRAIVYTVKNDEAANAFGSR
jgi:hypothetical protein